jgi:hypothetical protein
VRFSDSAATAHARAIVGRHGPTEESPTLFQAATTKAA